MVCVCASDVLLSNKEGELGGVTKAKEKKNREKNKKLNN